MHAFIHLAAERGIDATTTRAVADAAGVNEVTIFRHFGDKATLAREAIHHTAVVDRVGAYPLAIDVSTPDRAAGVTSPGSMAAGPVGLGNSRVRGPNRK